MKGPGFYIDALHNLARRGMRSPFTRTTKATHDNPLRRIGREMAALAARSVRVARTPKLVNGVLVSPTRRERRALMREHGITSGRQWVRLRKALAGAL